MTNCIFLSDLHGSISRYNKVFSLIESEKPNIILFGGDLLPSGIKYFSKGNTAYENFIVDFIKPNLDRIRNVLKNKYPKIFLILGNDDPRIDEKNILELESENYLEYIHNRKSTYSGYDFYGYSFIPPSPFHLKDWEKYDVSRYVDPGCISPEEGIRSVEQENDQIKYSTIRKDLKLLLESNNHEKSIFLFHCPPYKTALDRAALDGKMIDHVPLDVHIGSIAIKEAIENFQPLLTLHGHVHESTRLTGNWKEKIGNTISFNGAHDRSELSVIKFTLEAPENAERILL